MAESYRFVVSGYVQGVGFRYSAARQAQALALSGWVRNCDDGRVEGVACGDAAALGRFRDWLAQGPPAARIERVEWEAGAEPACGEGFVIRR